MMTSDGREARVMALLKRMKESLVEEESRISCRSSEATSPVCSCNAIFTVKQQERVPSDEQLIGQASEKWRPRQVKTLKQALSNVPPTIDDSHITQNDSEESDVNIGSKVRRLKLFWDQFFLTETKKGQINQIAEKEESCPTLIKINSKLKKKGGSRLGSAMSNDTRYKFKKKIIKEDSLEDVNLIPSRDVSTWVAKVTSYSESNEDLSVENTVSSVEESESIKSVADSSQLLRAQLYATYLSEESGEIQTVDAPVKEEPKSVPNSKDVYLNLLTGRRMSCCRRKGDSKRMVMQKSTQCYYEGVAVRLEIASRLVRPNPREIEDRVRKPRKPSTLLPCYYVSLRPDDPAAAGDAAVLALNRSDKKCKRPSNARTDFSYEKVCLNDGDGNPRETTTRIQLTVSKDSRPVRSAKTYLTYLLVHLLTFLLLIVLLLVCFTFVQPRTLAPLQ